MVLLISILVASIILGGIIIYFSGLAALSPYYWLLLLPIGIFASGILVSICWGGLLLFAAKYKKVECAGKGNKFYQTVAALLADLMLLASWRPIKKKGYGRLPKDVPCLFLFNHTSFVDCWMLLSSIKRRFSIVATKEMRNVPFVGNLSTALGNIYIDRQDPNSTKRMVELASDYIKNQNTSIAISPEGVVNRTGELKPFKNGCFHIAINTHCPIVLLSFNGIGQMDHRKNIFQPIKITSEVITVINAEQYETMNASELSKYCEDIFRDYQLGRNK